MAATGDELVTLSQLKSVMDGQLDLTDDSILVKNGSNVHGFGLFDEGNECVVSMGSLDDYSYLMLGSGQYASSFIQRKDSSIPTYSALDHSSPLFLDPLSSTYTSDLYSYFNIITLS